MTDPRYQKLASLLVNYSTEIKKGDFALLDMIDVPDEFSLELMRTVRAAGGTPFIEVRHTRVSREIVRQTDEKHAAALRDIELYRMKKMQAYIAIRGSANASENSDVAGDKMQLHSRRAELPGEQNPLVRTPLAHPQHGPGGGHEHRGL
jgi:aminopeptidase